MSLDRTKAQESLTAPSGSVGWSSITPEVKMSADEKIPRHMEMAPEDTSLQSRSSTQVLDKDSLALSVSDKSSCVKEEETYQNLPLLLDMGFKEKIAKLALIAAAGDLERAVDYILSNTLPSVSRNLQDLDEESSLESKNLLQVKTESVIPTESMIPAVTSSITQSTDKQTSSNAYNWYDDDNYPLPTAETGAVPKRKAIGKKT